MDNSQDNALTNYCFLAALTENQNDLYNHVFVPICKRALSLYSLRGATHGTAQDIQDIIKEEYGIDVPLKIVQKLITSVFKSLSRWQRSQFDADLFAHGDSFQLKQYSFSDLESKYKKGDRDARKLQLAFRDYLYSEQVDPDKCSSFGEFLDKNKRHIASFFKGNGAIRKGDIDKSYLCHIQFLEYIDTNDDELFRIAEQLYLGTIVAGFLESGVDLFPKFVSNEVYYLDTPLILRALDLQKEEDTKPTLELLDLIKNTGGSLKVLSVTLAELGDVINNAAESYNSKNPVTTIGDACVRLGKSKVWLINIGAKIESYISEKLGIEKATIPHTSIEKFEKSADVKALKDLRKRKGNAFHDVAAYLFVREQRGSTINAFQHANYWFITTNYELLVFNREHASINGITEIVLPDALTSMLWLKSPAKLITQVKKVGLRELMATTLNEEIASKELIGEFETAISSIEDVSTEDYNILLSSVAHQSAKRITEFNELATQDKNAAKQQAIAIIEKEKSRKAKHAEQIKEVQGEKKKAEDVNSILHQKIKALEEGQAQFKTEQVQFKTEIERLSSQIIDQKKFIKRSVLWFVVAVILVVCAVWGFRNFSSIISRVISIIVSSGGLWGLGSFVINLCKALHIIK